MREGKALKDNLYPSRIIVSNNSTKSEKFGYLLRDSALVKDIRCFFPNTQEAECIKLFSNTFLAMIGFFNELDSFALFNNLILKILLMVYVLMKG